MAACAERQLEGSQQIFVRLLGENRSVNIERGWSILQLKEHLSKITGRKLDELNIVFAGHILPDDLTLEVCIYSGFVCSFR